MGRQVSALREIGSHGWDRWAIALHCQLELSFHKMELKMQREAPGLALAQGLALWVAQEIKEGTWVLRGFPRGSAVKNQLQGRKCRRHGFSPWIRKILWRRKWQPTPVFLPEKFHGQRSLVGHMAHHEVTKSQTQHKRRSTHNWYCHLICSISSCFNISQVGWRQGQGEY